MVMSLTRLLQDAKLKYQANVMRAGVMVLVTIALGYLQVSDAQSQEGEPTLKQVLEKPVVDVTAEKQKVESAVPPKLPGPVDKVERGVPRTAVAGYFRAAAEADYEMAAEYLDLRNPPRGYRKNDGPELARQFKVILDRALWVDMDVLSTDPNGHKDDGLPSYRDFIGRIDLQIEAYSKEHRPF